MRRADEIFQKCDSDFASLGPFYGDVIILCSSADKNNMVRNVGVSFHMYVRIVLQASGTRKFCPDTRGSFRKGHNFEPLLNLKSSTFDLNASFTDRS